MKKYKDEFLFTFPSGTNIRNVWAYLKEKGLDVDYTMRGVIVKTFDGGSQAVTLINQSKDYGYSNIKQLHAKGSTIKGDKNIGKIIQMRKTADWFKVVTKRNDEDLYGKKKPNYTIIDVSKLKNGKIIANINHTEIEGFNDWSSKYEMVNSLPIKYKQAFDKLTDEYNVYAKGGGIEKENAEMVLNNNKQISHHTKELASAVKGKKVPAWVVAKVNRSANDLSDATHYLEGSKYGKGSTIKNKYEHNDFPIMFVEIPFGYGKKQGMLVTKLYNLLKKHNIAINNSKEWHTKGFGEEYENDENHNIVKFNVNDAPNPKKLTEILWNLPNGEYYVSATKDYKYAKGGTMKGFCYTIGGL